MMRGPVVVVVVCLPSPPKRLAPFMGIELITCEYGNFRLVNDRMGREREYMRVSEGAPVARQDGDTTCVCVAHR